MTWLVDAHVHYQHCFGWGRFLAGAAANLDAAAASRPDRSVAAGCLLFVDVEGENSLADLERTWSERAGRAGNGGIPAVWSLHPTAEPGAYRLERPRGAPLLLVRGRQIATREGLEVLAIACDRPLEERLPLETTVQQALAAGAITAIPWGFGKWWFARGKKVLRLLEGELGAQVHLGDNGNRPAAGGEPPAFETARQRGIGILPGSDPLPFPHHTRRALSYGFWLDGELDREHPGRSLRAGLSRLTGAPPTWGELRGLPGFVVDQVRMQLHARARRRSASAALSRTETQ